MQSLQTSNYSLACTPATSACVIQCSFLGSSRAQQTRDGNRSDRPIPVDGRVEIIPSNGKKIKR